MATRTPFKFPDTELALRVDVASGTVTYVGYAAPGTLNDTAAWQIKKITVSGNVTTVEWADGDNEPNNVWDNRASLTYS